jgi:hypothetical protein
MNIGDESVPGIPNCGYHPQFSMSFGTPGTLVRNAGVPRYSNVYVARTPGTPGTPKY